MTDPPLLRGGSDDAGPETKPAGERRYRLEATYTALALIAPSGTIVTFYRFQERRRAEMDTDRFNARAGDA